MIRMKVVGDFSKASSWLQRLLQKHHLSILDRYGKRGVEALKATTPRDTGLTAESWYYTIQNDEEHHRATLSFANSNVNKGVPIALLIQYGHGTRTGGWVEGRDYINPALDPIIDELLKNLVKEFNEL